MYQKKKDDHPEDKAELPYFPALSSKMKVDFLFNEEGQAWLLHDKPLPAILKWVEYDVDMESLTLVEADGKVQDIGLKVPATMASRIEAATIITVMLMENGEVVDLAMVPLLTRQGMLN